jgi:hypothetical protein
MSDIKIDLKNTDIKTIIIRKTHDVKLEDEFKYKDLPPDEEIVVFTLHKEYHELDKNEKLQVLRGILNDVVDELGRVNHS